MKVQVQNLIFSLSQEAQNAEYLLCGKQVTADNGDFWRLILDDGRRWEIPIFSHSQVGTVDEDANGLTIRYDKLVSAYGDTFDVTLEIKVTKNGDLLQFSPTVTNRHEGVRVNECFCPLMDVEAIVGEQEEDILYRPCGLGERIPNPWKKLTDMTSHYYTHDPNEVAWHMQYPGASMSWFGVQSAEKFLYMARYDKDIRHCLLTLRQKIRKKPRDLMLEINHFPMARYGETVALPGGVVGLLDGDWRAGADLYRAYAYEAFYKVTEKADWVKNMTGWQRIIMRSQYGEDYYTAEDLPRLYEIGKQYGIHTLFLFAWWKEGLDNAYPKYEEPYEGAYEDLKRNIRKVREMGGRVILECNCNFMDPKGDFYRQYGDEVKILDIHGQEVRTPMGYPGYGEFRQHFGAPRLPECCSCTARWRDQVFSQIELMNAIDADGLFSDCYGAAPYAPCFNDRHEHGPRVDRDWTGKRKYFERTEAYCHEQGKVAAAEVLTDIAASYNQFIHGLHNASFETKGVFFAPLFRYTFPDVITTNRGVRCSEGDYANQLRHACIMGVRMDAELFVCRAALDADPDYAAVIGECTGYMKEYEEFLMKGTFTVWDVRPLPSCVKRAEHISEDGTRLLTALLNCSDKEIEAAGKILPPGKPVFSVTAY